MHGRDPNSPKNITDPNIKLFIATWLFCAYIFDSLLQEVRLNIGNPTNIHVVRREFQAAKFEQKSLTNRSVSADRIRYLRLVKCPKPVFFLFILQCCSRLVKVLGTSFLGWGPRVGKTERGTVGKLTTVDKSNTG